MKKTFILVLWLIGALTLSANPTIKFKETIIDFGSIPSGKIVDIKFEFENIGDQVLKIIDIAPTCGCTTIGLQKKEYAPGEKGVIPVQFNSSGYQSKVVKTVVVRSNDPLQTSVNLTLTGVVVGQQGQGPAAKSEGKAAEVKPDSLAFGAVKVGSTESLRFTILNHGNRELRILEVQHVPDLHLAFPKKAKVIPANGLLDVEVVLHPFEKGNLTTLVKIRVNDNQNPYLLVRVEADVE